MNEIDELPHFFLAQIQNTADARNYLNDAATMAKLHGARILAKQASENVECLEAGTPSASILLAEFTGRAALNEFWQDDDQQSIFRQIVNADPLILAAPGLPAAGLPDMLEIPTTASVKPPADRGPRAYMIIQGTGTDEARMDQYRDIILPMLKEQGAYYTAFEIEGNTKVLAGNWPYEIFAVSRWPDHAAGHAFWDSDRYQNAAIPVRTGAGSFWVHFMVGETG